MTGHAMGLHTGHGGAAPAQALLRELLGWAVAQGHAEPWLSLRAVQSWTRCP